MTHPIRLWLTLLPVALSVFALPHQAAAQMRSPMASPATSAEPDLSPAQKAKVQARVTQFKQQVVALRADKTLTNPQKEEKFLQLRQSLDQDMLSYLTPQQRSVVMQARQKMMQQQQTNAAMMQSRISQINQLAMEINKSETPVQLKKLHDIGVIERARIQKMQTNGALSEQAKRSQLGGIRADATTKINAVLTPSQRAKFARLQKLTDTSQ